MGKGKKKPAKNPWAQAAAFARAKKLTPERRSEIARKAGLASGRARAAYLGCTNCAPNPCVCVSDPEMVEA